MILSQNAINRTRLGSGLVLFAFVASHLLNHALGLIGLEAMEAGRMAFLFVWRNPVGTTILYGALATHLALVLFSVYRRRSWRLISRGEIMQVLLGLLVPPLVVVHALANRGQHEVFGLEDNYAFVLLAIWEFNWLDGLQQSTASLVAWFHGCIGVNYWLRLKPWYETWRIRLHAAAVLIPALSLTGFLSGAREASLLYADPIWRARHLARINLPGQPGIDWVNNAATIAFAAMIAILLALLVAWAVRYIVEVRKGIVILTYPEGQRVRIKPGITVLEASREAGIPHASVCGGRGRCSTCRVRTGLGAEHLEPPSEEEVRVLSRVGAPEGVRLACQIRPRQDLSVVPLLPPGAGARDGFDRPGYVQGSEREICILFADLRGFTRFSELKLPYDVVFVLNQYFRAMGQAVEKAGGQLDKFIGDGVMALFGLHNGSAAGCRDALEAARAMAQALEALNESLKHDLPEPLRMGIGLHAGTVIVGEMGYARAMTVTAIGDAVNTASRLEGMTKEFTVQLVVSRRVSKRAGVDLKMFPRREIEVRGRRQPMPIYLIKSALDLPATGPAPEQPAKETT